MPLSNPAMPTRNLTLVDIMKGHNPDGSYSPIIELLNQTNPFLQHIPFMRGNMDAGHKTTIRTGLDEGTFTRLYRGVPFSKSEVAEITESTALLKAYSRVDADMSDFSPNLLMDRMRSDMGVLEGMMQQAARAFLYENDANNPDSIIGLSSRYNSLTAEIGDNIIDAGGTSGDLGSIWMIDWSEDSVCGIYPKWAKEGTGGIQMIDRGEQVSENSGTGEGVITTQTTEFKWHLGLCVKDWRKAVRICNIPRSSLVANPSRTAQPDGTNIVLQHLLHRARTELPAGTRNPRIYMDKTMLSTLQSQASFMSAESTLTYDQVGGIPTQSWQGMELYRTDALATTEARVQ